MNRTHPEPRTPFSLPIPDPGFLEAWPVLLAAGLYFVALGLYAGALLNHPDPGDLSAFVALAHQAFGATGVVALAFGCAWVLLVRAFQEFRSAPAAA